MSNTPKPGSPQEWLDHARSDLAYARKGEGDPDILPNQVAFHAQQAAEKAIKAVLLLRCVSFPKTHDVKELIKRWTDLGEQWPTSLEDAKILNPYAVETRYPGYVHQITRAELRTAIDIAARVVDWAETTISSAAPASPLPHSNTKGSS